MVGFELDSVFDCFLRVFLLGAWLLFLGVGCLLVFVGFCFMKSSFLSGFLASNFFFGEFDPGSGRTLAACLTHASRTMKLGACTGWISGERASNT